MYVKYDSRLTIQILKICTEPTQTLLRRPIYVQAKPLCRLHLLVWTTLLKELMGYMRTSPFK